MKAFVLRKQQFVSSPLREVFAFFEKPENLELITPPALSFHIVSPRPISMKKDATIDYTIKVLGIRRCWQTRILEYEPMHRFVDEQLKGPYKSWLHTHTFREQDNGTLVIDEVSYIMPFGILGRLVHAIFVRSQLQNIFEFRSRLIQELFDDPGTKMASASVVAGSG